METNKISSDVESTAKNKALQAKLQRKPAPEPQATKGIAEQDSLLQQGLKRMQRSSAAVKTKEHAAKDEKIHGIVSSRKQISTPSSSVSTKGPSKGSVKKAIALKR